MAAGVADFAVDEGVERGDARAADGVARVCGGAEGGDGPGAVAVVGAGRGRLAWSCGNGVGETRERGMGWVGDGLPEMLCDFSLETVMLD